MRGLASEKNLMESVFAIVEQAETKLKRSQAKSQFLENPLVSNSQRFRIEGLGTTSEVASLGAKRLCIYPNNKTIWPTRIAPTTLETEKLGG